MAEDRWSSLCRCRSYGGKIYRISLSKNTT
jgi:hypothetical protein